MKKLLHSQLIPLLTALMLLLATGLQAAAADAAASAIKRFSLTNIPGKQVSGNVDFKALLAQSGPGAEDPNQSIANVSLETFPPSSVRVAGIYRRPGRADSLLIDFEGNPGTATIAYICFAKIRFEGAPDAQNVCKQGPIINAANLPAMQMGLLQGLVRGSSPMVQRNTRVTQTILDPSTVSDAYGTRISKKFVVFQVTVGNKSPDYEFLVHDISVRFSFKLLNSDAKSTPAIGKYTQAVTPDSSGMASCEDTSAGKNSTCIELSSLDLSILQGVAERGSYTDTRNLVLRALTAAGTVAAGLHGVTDFGASYSPAVAAFNGPLLTAYKEMFPDYTINQLNRLNARAYKANTVVPKSQAGVIAVFVPQAILMDRADSRAFLKDPHSIITRQNFAEIKILVDGMFITSADALAPSISNVTFVADPGKAQSDKPELKGFVLGGALSDVTIALGSGAPKGATVTIDGTPSENRLDFTLKADGPIPPDTWVEIVLTKGTTTARSSGLITYHPAAPIAKVDPFTGALGTTVAITMTGSGFFPGATNVEVALPGSKLTVSNLHADKETPATKMTFTLAIDGNAKVGHYPITVGTSIGNVQVDFEVTAK